MRTLTLFDSICWAMVFIFEAEPFAFWMSHDSLYFAQSAFERVRVGGDPAGRGRGVGQDDADLGALAVDRFRCCTAGAELELALDAEQPPADAAVELLLFLLLELHAVRASNVAVPSTAIVTEVFLMRRSRLSRVS